MKASLTQPMRFVLTIVITALAFGSCHSDSSQQLLSPEEVQRQLNTAYAVEDRGDTMGADSIYQALLSHQLSPTDSAGVSGSYLSVLFKEGEYRNALIHVDRAFPANCTNHSDLLRRYSYRFRAYLAMRQCDSIRFELAKLFELVESDSALQLSMEDIIQYRSVVDSICGPAAKAGRMRSAGSGSRPASVIAASIPAGFRPDVP